MNVLIHFHIYLSCFGAHSYLNVNICDPSVILLLLGDVQSSLPG